MLEQKIHERRMSLEEFVQFAGEFAREHREPGTLGLRHLQRLVTGKRENGEPLGRVRLVTARLLEGIFGMGIEELLREPVHEPVATVGGPPGQAVVDLAVAVDWLDERAGWSSGTAREKVHVAARKLESDVLLDRQAWRGKVGRSQLVGALRAFYGDVDGYGMYRARFGGVDVATTVLSRAEWVGLSASLMDAGERWTLALGQAPRAELGAVAAEAAVARLAESAVLGVRLANLPLYRLLGFESDGTVSGTLGQVPFVEYALTADLLENELVDAVRARSAVLPLRSEYLPDLEAVLDLPGRGCAGGVVALCAIARPHDRFRGPADYALLVQERSGHVLNTVGQLAVIPKGFHQPLNDLRGDSRIGATLLRELEEELFGRGEVDTTLGGSRAAAPMHPGRWSEPMRWLAEDAGRLRVECTGFGLNLISGNYEFAGLVVIEDEEFWPRFGGQVETNWEAAGLRLFSSLDGDLVTDLVGQESWSNEGVFALLQGLRRLREVGGERVRLPAVEVSGL
ncbi:transcriptional regulator [Actinosynnema sp. NPDC020468]|uniref:transcriptional regulator n=1 Tax=Actinosynnema sp. NPDC020468 TaxID=3154488 RepID=UPI0033C0C3ED